jgi:integrase/recombinase XerD
MLIHRFCQHLEILNYSPRTIQGQKSFLLMLHTFLDAAKCADVQTVTSGLLLDFQRDIFYEPSARGTARSISSQNHAIIAVKNFFRFLKNEGYLAHDPAEPLRCAREPHMLPRNILTPQEALKIIEAPDTGSLLGYRDRTILEVLYATGIRKSEVMNLTVADVNFEEELLRINGGKGAKDRVVPLTSVACSYLENYIKAIRPDLLGNNQSQALFISFRGRPISRNALGDLATKYGKKAGIKKHMTCHLWRHSCATHLVKNKANLRHVQEILGHRSLSTTERYLHLTISDIKEAHRKFHPREITAKKES